MWREARDWNVDFFKKTGYTVYCTLNDYQSGTANTKCWNGFDQTCEVRRCPVCRENEINLSMQFIKKRRKIFSVLKKRAARTCAIIRVWDYPNEPDLASSLPIRIGTLLASYRCDNGSWRKICILLRVCPACQVLKDGQARTLTSETVNRFQAYWQFKSVLVYLYRSWKWILGESGSSRFVAGSLPMTGWVIGSYRVSVG